MLYLANAFSINMLPRTSHIITFTPITKEEASALLGYGFTSTVGHTDTANVLKEVLGLPIPVNRANITLNDSDMVVVAQYVGPRLPEGATSLPEGAKIEFWLVKV